jgi:phosphate transport system ATP-binding protein
VTNSTEIEVKDLDFFYDERTHVLKNINLKIYKNTITTIIGPSGSGKSTFIRCFNRLHDLYPSRIYKGQVLYKNKNILSSSANLSDIRTEIGMVFQKPTSFPMSIYENVAYGLRLKGIKDKKTLDNLVIKNLEKTALWEELKNKLHSNSHELSLGQQQRLSIARAIALNPHIMLFDEPTSSLDPIATVKIEDLVKSLKNVMTIIMVTHNLKQAERISDYSAFLVDGQLIETDESKIILSQPKHSMTLDYINGRFN